MQFITWVTGPTSRTKGPAAGNAITMRILRDMGVVVAIAETRARQIGPTARTAWRHCVIADLRPILFRPLNLYVVLGWNNEYGKITIPNY